MRDVELSAREGVGDVATASQIETKSQVVDVRLTRNVVVAVSRQSNPLPFQSFFDSKRPGARRTCSETVAIASLFGRHDRCLVHRQQRDEKRERLVEVDIDRVRVANRDAGKLLRFSRQDLFRSAHVAENPTARRLQLGRQQSHETVVDVARFEEPSVVKADPAAQAQAIAMALFENLPALR